MAQVHVTTCPGHVSWCLRSTISILALSLLQSGYQQWTGKHIQVVNIFFITCINISRVTMMVEESNITRSEDDYLNAEKDVNVTDAVFPLAMR